MTPEDYKAERSRRTCDTFQLDPQVGITLKGVKYTLEFNNWTVKEVLKDTGINLLSHALKGTDIEDPDVMSVLLLRGLQTNHPDMETERADKLMTLRHFPYILNRISTAIDLFMPDMTGVILDKVEDAAEVDSSDSEDPTQQQTDAGSSTLEMPELLESQKKNSGALLGQRSRASY